MRGEIGGEGGKGLAIAARRGKQQPALVGVVEQGQEALAAACAALVHRDPPDLRVIGLGAGPLHVMLQHAPDPAIGDAEQAGHDQRRHLPAQATMNASIVSEKPEPLRLHGTSTWLIFPHRPHATRGNSAWI